MSEIGVERVFIGAGCNRIVNNISWGACDLVSFGAQNAVVIFCPKAAQILTTLPGHKAAINCTHWLPNNKFTYNAKHLERHYLLSGDADGAIILWEWSLIDKKWRNVLELPKSHKKGVTCITGILLSDSDAMFASTSSNGVVNVWDVSFPSKVGGECKVSCLESLSVGSKSMVALSLAELPQNAGHLILAMGGLDNKIKLYCGERTGKFFCASELKGHTDWIRSLDFSLPIRIDGQDNIIMLVSSAQDKVMRIWKITPANIQRKEISLASYIEGPIFASGSLSYQVSVESILIGHEDWVYSVEWQPPVPTSEEGMSCYQPHRVLSASMDKTMMIWEPEKKTGIWMNVVTVGELSHCALGFYGGHWSPDGLSILAHGYGGSFHLWRNVGGDVENWQPQKVPSGHFAAVTDIAWARNGEYLLSVSHDQTTRVFSSWKNGASHIDEAGWHEIARPQVHGHDINCVTIIQGKGNQRFVSGADEKVARVFEAPMSFLKTLNHATAKDPSFSEDLQMDVQVLGANMSALGLSQKPIYAHTTHEMQDGKAGNGMDTLETVPEAVPVEFTETPIEDQLAWHTLWPESHKLYGHGNELFSLSCDHSGKLVASSCKAQSAAVADIWVWEVGSWKAVGRLQSHSLTVTQMEFSHDDSLLLSVSRDRHFSVFAIDRTVETGVMRQKLLAKQEAHKRIIWACSWNPSGHEFATGSRDKTVKIWAVDRQTSSTRQILALPQFGSGVTALSWLSCGCAQQGDRGLLAVGTESGLIQLWNVYLKRPNDGTVEEQHSEVSLAVCFDPLMCHVAAVNRLAWRNTEETGDCRRLQLASCGADNCVRVFEVKV